MGHHGAFSIQYIFRIMAYPSLGKRFYAFAPRILEWSALPFLAALRRYPGVLIDGRILPPPSLDVHGILELAHIRYKRQSRFDLSC